MKKSFKEERYIEGSKVYSLCNEYQYYTQGTNEEYETMFDYYCGGCIYGIKKITPAKIEQLANNILLHSNIEKLQYTFGGSYIELKTMIISQIVNECCTIKIIIE